MISALVGGQRQMMKTHAIEHALRTLEKLNTLLIEVTVLLQQRLLNETLH